MTIRAKTAGVILANRPESTDDYIGYGLANGAKGHR